MTQQEELIKFIKESPLVNAAITEAVHRFYYDRILADDKKQKEEVHEIGYIIYPLEFTT
jgi:hypothetical protein